MNIEENRLATLENWPILSADRPGIPSASEISAAGFYSTKNGLEVQCYWCLGKINDWRAGDVALERHKRLSPTCPFVTNPRISGNIPVSSDIDFHDELTRLETYANWPLTFLTPLTLARAGFYYINRSDQVKCAFCQGVIGQWEIGDDPFLEHLKFFPTCPKARACESECTTDFGLGIQPVRPPKATEFASLDARIRSFQTWRFSHIQDPRQLAEAGFYYLGNEDEVRCFNCDGGLRFWLEDDDPWFEHARWFPKCPFVLLAKGHQYVAGVQEQNKNQPSTTTTQSNLTPPVVPLTLEEAMAAEPVQTCLAMGLSVGRIRALTKRQIDRTGRPYLNSQVLAEAVLDEQIENECDEESQRRPMQSTVSTLLWSAIAASSSATPPTATESTSSAHEKVEPEQLVASGAPTVRADGKEKEKDAKRAAASPAKKDDGPMSLEEENKRLKDARECKICMSEEIGVVFVPCGHLVTCIQCAPAILNCPVCRADIRGRVRTFLP